ncbi:hypothetical protein NAEGRDRAFT_79763 [Naegleria gruberi]|uniref:Uncharacterized protein n=1 Tax=Naegleria gruberi TaxID=5762 RepID=D2VFH1_NAEGR|nr:uncharacterized protein NAEGRDRAFT_79763 [Naegleria gruberi]EFC44463.1 hypothetical protein NAEGRDRAFT_79763 [Naegleria gruberi]|eukprot:XP_002677207.1 hypothetical protein NAEGRDRAFT_79763 [Naegleria gruberi strain NEG-M]
MPAITSSAVCLGSASSSVGSLLHRSSNGSISSCHIDKDSYMKRNISNSYDSIENFSSSSSPLDELLNDESCELDKNEIRKILIRTLPPLPKTQNPYKRILDNRIVAMIKETIPFRSNFDGNIKQYYDLNLVIPPSLLEFVHGFEWDADRKFLNPKLNIISGPVRFSKLESLDMICKYPALQQVSDINSIIFIAVGKDILGVRVSDILHSPSNFNLQIFRENSFRIEERSLLEIVEGFSCWNIDSKNL